MRIVLTERELDLMSVLWRRGPSTVSELRAELQDNIAHNTVLTFLKILEEKGHVRHTEEGRSHRFHAVIAPEDVAAGALNRMLDAVFGGSAQALLTHFVNQERLSRSDLESMRALLDERLGQPDDGTGDPNFGGPDR